MEKTLNKENILILKGGYNEEHEVSLSTAKEVKNAILDLGYNLQSIEVDPNNFHEEIKKFNVDICFNALHGSYGEDGAVQKILVDNNINFTHSGIKASSIAFNKYLTKKAIEKTSINCPKSILFNRLQLNREFFEKCFMKTGPFVLKPVSSGSSYGVQLIKSFDDINTFSNNLNKKKLYENHEMLIIEPYIEGKELTVAVIEEKGVSKSIEVTEIISKNNFFDYEAKYSTGKSKHILPAKIPKNIYLECLNNAKIVHDLIGCRGLSRSDFIYDQINDKLYFLEINTQPGLTMISLVPEQLKYNNIDFIKLIDNLLETSLCQK